MIYFFVITGYLNLEVLVKVGLYLFYLLCMELGVLIRKADSMRRFVQLDSNPKAWPAIK